MTRVRRSALLLVLLLLAGCGLGGGSETSQPVRVFVSRDFGGQQVGRSATGVARGETVLGLLQRSFDVQTRGRAVQEIQGVPSGRLGDARPVGWFYYVNGIEADTSAASRRLAAGDRVWWDFHDRGVATRIPAVVGSFPEPFLSGNEGRKIPVRIECAAATQRECGEVQRRLAIAGVKRTARAGLGQAAAEGVLRVLVGPWTLLRRDPAARGIERGPQSSGVYARLSGDGRRMELLDERGAVVRRVGAGAGLVAATSIREDAPVWVVTGTDEAGVAAAAGALEEGILSRRFALAIDEGRGVPLPLDSKRQ
jgi:hypothetical protein